MSYTNIDRCRICGNAAFIPILHLGEQALTGVFPKTPDQPVTVGPIDLIKCDEAHAGCGLVQLRQSYAPTDMYGENYGYRSGLNPSMVQHLRRRVREALRMAEPQPGDLILDVGSNDSTLLQAYPQSGWELVGIDPTGHKFADYYPDHIALIPDFFDARTLARRCPGRKAKIVTSIAMFYDLECPESFMQQIHRVLDNEGIWVFEQSYLPAMIAANAYDTVCHEHLNYYAFQQIQWMTDRTGFKILDVELNEVNGGSFCVTVAKSSSSYRENTERIEQLLAQEEQAELNTPRPFVTFRENAYRHRDELRAFVRDVARRGKLICGYGASTKGNVMLQFCGFSAEDLPAIAEINADKYGAYTPNSLIPIRSEAEVRQLRPDYLLVLPWHFREGIVRREAKYLAEGGRLVFPLPRLEVVEHEARKRAAA